MEQTSSLLAPIKSYTNDRLQVNLERREVLISNENGYTKYIVEKIVEIFDSFPGAGFIRIYIDPNIKLYYSGQRVLKFYIKRNLMDIMATKITNFLDNLNSDKYQNKEKND